MRTLVTKTSARASSSSATPRPASDARSSTMLRLPRLSCSKGGLLGRSPPSMRAKVRDGSPSPCGSIFTTSAPQSASTQPAAGPATQTPISTTRIPSSGPPMPTPSRSSAYYVTAARPRCIASAYLPARPRLSRRASARARSSLRRRTPVAASTIFQCMRGPKSGCDSTMTTRSSPGSKPHCAWTASSSCLPFRCPSPKFQPSDHAAEDLAVDPLVVVDVVDRARQRLEQRPALEVHEAMRQRERDRHLDARPRRAAASRAARASCPRPSRACRASAALPLRTSQML